MAKVGGRWGHTCCEMGISLGEVHRQPGGCISHIIFLFVCRILFISYLQIVFKKIMTKHDLKKIFLHQLIILAHTCWFADGYINYE